MFNSLLRNIPLTLLAISLFLNGILFFVGNHYRGELSSLQSNLTDTEQSLRECQKANSSWETSYDTLMEACKVQSEVIVELGKDLHEERKGSGDVIREILLMPLDQDEKGVSKTENTRTSGETNETQIPYAPPVAGLDDRLPDSLYEALQRAYNGDKASAAPNP